MRLANEAINYWANYDGTYWKELFTTAQVAGDGDVTIDGVTTAYAAPEDMREAGGFIKILDSNGKTVRRYRILEPQEAQFQIDDSYYTYFTGDPTNGYTLNLNPAPDSSIDGYAIDYVYYKQPTLFESGDDVTEMANPYFIVHRMLANQFRAARNPYYSSAKADAENALRIMQLDNNSGTWANPWSQADNSGNSWGQ